MAEVVVCQLKEPKVEGSNLDAGRNFSTGKVA
jgi:hypothetical protein